MSSRNTKLARLMLSNGVSGTDLAAAIKVNKAHMSQIKNGHHNMTIDTLKKLCRVMKCSPNEVLDWEEWIGPEN